MVGNFRVAELQAFLGAAGRSKTGRKAELLKRALILLDQTDIGPALTLKIRELDKLVHHKLAFVRVTQFLGRYWQFLTTFEFYRNLRIHKICTYNLKGFCCKISLLLIITRYLTSRMVENYYPTLAFYIESMSKFVTKFLMVGYCFNSWCL